jgi:hypothetical protein
MPPEVVDPIESNSHSLAMKRFLIGLGILTVSLLIGLVAFAVLLPFGVIELRVRSDRTATVPSRSVEVSGAKARLLVQRGLHPNLVYPIFEGVNFIGRANEVPVDIDLEPQEGPDRVWTSFQHAVITYKGNAMCIEDLGSMNGTYVNRRRVHEGVKCLLRDGDTIQIGWVQLKVQM